ncbi:MAG: FUSC family protein, partial [Bdellovibrionales bacterium]|nr:FUSC family protein [Bdellovibrionales bacterium]
MLLSALVITTPLIIGYFTHDLFVSMFGSLMGLVLYLNDHFGNLKVRFMHLAAAFILLMLSLYVGSLLVGNMPAIIIILFILSFAVGKSKNFGIELERLMLFITLQFLTASSESIFTVHIFHLILFSCLSFANYLLWASVIYYITKHQTAPMISKLETVKHIIAHNKSSYFPLVCAVFSCVGFMAAQFFKFAHANWIVGTALIVILPDSYLGIYKSAQRLFGTIIGVLIAAALLNYVHDTRVLLVFVFAFSFLMPHGLVKNYWVANIYIAALILLFLEIAAPLSIATHHLAFWRIVDIALGSFIGILAAIWLRPSLV